MVSPELRRNYSTGCVSCGGWERGRALETEKAQSQENAKKRGAYPPSAARCVGQHWMTSTYVGKNNSIVSLIVSTSKASPKPAKLGIAPAPSCTGAYFVSATIPSRTGGAAPITIVLP